MTDSQQTPTSDDHRDERCAPAARVPRGVQAPDMMVIRFRLDGACEPRAQAYYCGPHHAPVLEVRLCPNGERLPDLAKALRTLADKLAPLYGDFDRKRQHNVDTIRETAERMLTNLRKTEIDNQQVLNALKSIHADEANHADDAFPDDEAFAAYDPDMPF